MELPGLPLLRQGMFEPYLKSFYIRSTDPTQIKILKVSDGEKWYSLFAPLSIPTDPLRYPQGPPGCLPVSGAEPMVAPAKSVCSGSRADESGGMGTGLPSA